MVKSPPPLASGSQTELRASSDTNLASASKVNVPETIPEKGSDLPDVPVIEGRPISRAPSVVKLFDAQSVCHQACYLLLLIDDL